jgi:hypothetical protein
MNRDGECESEKRDVKFESENRLGGWKWKWRAGWDLMLCYETKPSQTKQTIEDIEFRIGIRGIAFLMSTMNCELGLGTREPSFQFS